MKELFIIKKKINASGYDIKNQKHYLDIKNNFIPSKKLFFDKKLSTFNSKELQKVKDKLWTTVSCITKGAHLQKWCVDLLKL